MNYNVETNYKMDSSLFKNKQLINAMKKLNNLFLKETYKGNKVSYYYEDLNGNVISYNKDICFYAASAIKILVCLYIMEKARSKKIDLNTKLLVKMDELKPDTGIIKNQKNNQEYSVKELIKYTLVESDNTAYLKLVNYVGKETLKEYGRSLGAKFTMIGKETDSFGIISCSDMIIYWKNVKKFIDRNDDYGNLLKKYLSNPTYKIVENDGVLKYNYVRKYGSYDIAYHEAGYVETSKPYFMIILTQLNKESYKKKFVNDTSKLLLNINKILNERED